MTKEIPFTDKQVALIMKAALEFNATIVQAATLYYGNCTTLRNQRNAQKLFKELFKGYTNRLKVLMNPNLEEAQDGE